MNAKSWAKRCRSPAAALALATCLVGAGADDGNLDRRYLSEQRKSAFELKLEQVRESARRRAAEKRAQGTAGERRSIPADLGNASQSVRLEPVRVTEPAKPDGQPPSLRRLRAEQAYDRDQRRILDQRQRRSALVASTRRTPPAGAERYAEKRRLRMRMRSQDQRLSLQRKLRR